MGPHDELPLLGRSLTLCPVSSSVRRTPLPPSSIVGTKVPEAPGPGPALCPAVVLLEGEALAPAAGFQLFLKAELLSREGAHPSPAPIAAPVGSKLRPPRAARP